MTMWMNGVTEQAEEPAQTRDDVSESDSNVAVQEVVKPAPARVARMPQWRVLLHNDDVNIIEDVIRAIQEICKFNHIEALKRTLEAHQTGIALLLTTHREHAELVQEQFESKLLTVTIEPER